MTILIPAYEPDNRMTALLRRIRESCDFKILIVDDGSGPDYRRLFEEAQALGCTVLTQERNMGKGAALRRGFKWLTEEGEDGKPRETRGVVCADCDGQHTVPDILRVAEKALENPGAMVLGKRDFSFGRGPDGAPRAVPKRSMLGNTVTRKAFALVAGVQVYDANTGLRAYTADMLGYLCEVPGDRFEYEMNLLVYSGRDGIEVIEIPIETVYEIDTHTSHFRTVRDTIRVSAALLRFCVSSAIAFLADTGLYFLFLALFAPYGLGRDASLLLAVMLARVISAHLNFYLNMRFVFRGGGRASYPKYIALAGVIMAANYGIQLLFITALGWPVAAVKFITEALLFSASFLAQRMFVFKRGRAARA
ncbi:MAG: bifunctional glycosyltransferase family 2/GtrA family protein [Oscillospiraceae bacterium]|jgi:glycosyltransferase involved in cell wall biosynthesis|nr:bifunctional glycosyltransferase family 2/GtrA family protein [Oscillospiraceae bacterium]